MLPGFFVEGLSVSCLAEAAFLLLIRHHYGSHAYW
jgi:hypothetical protein